MKWVDSEGYMTAAGLKIVLDGLVVLIVLCVMVRLFF
jgi:hypothetical protein